MNKFLLLALWYIAWSTVSSLYNDKKWKELKKELNKSCTDEETCTKSILLENFIETHRNFFKELKTKFNEDDTKAMLADKKQEVIDLIEKYKNDSEWLIDELSLKWKKYLKTADEKLKEFYQEKKVEWEKFLNSIWKSEEVADFKIHLFKVYEELKAKIWNKSV